MLGIEINGESLDLSPGTTLEMELNNPFLQLTEEISGEFSLPVQVQNTPKNLRLLQYAGLPQTRPDYRGLEAKVYDAGKQHSTGKIKLEKAQHNLNRTADGKVSFYYLSGTSSFFQDIKDIKLRSIDTGGNRVFETDSLNRDGNGFWGHIHKVIDAPVGAYDYAFYPVINLAIDPQKGNPIQVMNRMTYVGGKPTFHFFSPSGNNNIIVPFPYLKYILQRVAERIGYSIEGDILNDADFKKITLLNFKAINWIWLNHTAPWYKPAIINLSECLPNITISEFLLGLKNYFGWWYDIDRITKKIRIKELKNVIGLTVKDYSKYASPLLEKSVLQKKKTYAIKLKGESDFKGIKADGVVSQVSELPAPSTAVEKIYLVKADNNFYICRSNDNQSAAAWEFFDYNTHGYTPEGATDEINTPVSVPGMGFYDSYLDFLPKTDVEPMLWEGYGTDDWEPVLCFYHGQMSNKAGQLYPYASSHIYNSTGGQVTNWSLTFDCRKFDGSPVGLYDLNWKPFITKLNTTEEFEVKLNLPRHEYMQLDYSKIISVNHVRMYVKRIKTTIPYNGTIQLECSRI